ncbi:hypothetical protein C6P40_002362, partial [Pichia californica]
MLIFSILLFINFSFAIYIPNLNIRNDIDIDNDNSIDRFKVDSSLIPGYQKIWDENLYMNAGHIPITEFNSSLYFWSFQSKNESW